MLLFIIALLQYARASKGARPAYRALVRIAWYDAIAPFSLRAAQAYMNWTSTLRPAVWDAWRAMTNPVYTGELVVSQRGKITRFDKYLHECIATLTSRVDACWTTCDTSTDDIDAVRLAAIQERAKFDAVTASAYAQSPLPPTEPTFQDAMNTALDLYVVAKGLVKPETIGITTESHPDVWAALQPPKL